ncbi:hypothetical protein FKM82_031076 [Ascaphus truei]
MFLKLLLLICNNLISGRICVLHVNFFFISFNSKLPFCVPSAPGDVPSVSDMKMSLAETQNVSCWNVSS